MGSGRRRRLARAARVHRPRMAVLEELRRVAHRTLGVRRARAALAHADDEAQEREG